MSGPRRIDHAAFLQEARAQGVDRDDLAFVCVTCGTVQSMRTLRAAGAPEPVDRFIGFSCEGRWRKAGPYRPEGPHVRGCDWTLGGLFTFHKLVVVLPDGTDRPTFELATPDQARELAAAPLDALPIRQEIAPA